MRAKLAKAVQHERGPRKPKHRIEAGPRANLAPEGVTGASIDTGLSSGSINPLIIHQRSSSKLINNLIVVNSNGASSHHHLLEHQLLPSAMHQIKHATKERTRSLGISNRNNNYSNNINSINDNNVNRIHFDRTSCTSFNNNNNINSIANNDNIVQQTAAATTETMKHHQDFRASHHHHQQYNLSNNYANKTVLYNNNANNNYNYNESINHQSIVGNNHFIQDKHSYIMQDDDGSSSDDSFVEVVSVSPSISSSTTTTTSSMTISTTIKKQTIDRKQMVTGKKNQRRHYQQAGMTQQRMHKNNNNSKVRIGDPLNSRAAINSHGIIDEHKQKQLNSDSANLSKVHLNGRLSSNETLRKITDEEKEQRTSFKSINPLTIASLCSKPTKSTPNHTSHNAYDNSRGDQTEDNRMKRVQSRKEIDHELSCYAANENKINNCSEYYNNQKHTITDSSINDGRYSSMISQELARSSIYGNLWKRSCGQAKDATSQMVDQEEENRVHHLEIGPSNSNNSTNNDHKNEGSTETSLQYLPMERIEPSKSDNSDISRQRPHTTDCLKIVKQDYNYPPTTLSENNTTTSKCLSGHELHLNNHLGVRVTPRAVIEASDPSLFNQDRIRLDGLRKDSVSYERPESSSTSFQSSAAVNIEGHGSTTISSHLASDSSSQLAVPSQMSDDMQLVLTGGDKVSTDDQQPNNVWNMLFNRYHSSQNLNSTDPKHVMNAFAAHLMNLTQANNQAALDDYHSDNQLATDVGSQINNNSSNTNNNSGLSSSATANFHSVTTDYKKLAEKYDPTKAFIDFKHSPILDNFVPITSPIDPQNPFSSVSLYQQQQQQQQRNQSNSGPLPFLNNSALANRPQHTQLELESDQSMSLSSLGLPTNSIPVMGSTSSDTMPYPSLTLMNKLQSSPYNNMAHQDQQQQLLLLQTQQRNHPWLAYMLGNFPTFTSSALSSLMYPQRFGHQTMRNCNNAIDKRSTGSPSNNSNFNQSVEFRQILYNAVGQRELMVDTMEESVSKNT